MSKKKNTARLMAEYEKLEREEYDQELEERELENVEEDEDLDDDQEEQDEEDLYAPIEVTAKYKEVPVAVDGEKYVLRACSAKDRAAYMTMMRRKVQFTNGKPTGVLSDYNGVDTGLVAMCLFRKQGGNLKPVKVEEIGKWPPDTITTLFKRCQKLCGMDQKAEKRTAKN